MGWRRISNIPYLSELIMAIFSAPLGINLTNHQPLIDSPFTGPENGSIPNIGPVGFVMITEAGVFMITEISLDFMVTE